MPPGIANAALIASSAASAIAVDAGLAGSVSRSLARSSVALCFIPVMRLSLGNGAKPVVLSFVKISFTFPIRAIASSGNSVELTSSKLGTLVLRFAQPVRL
eukprot:CAMPEP_0203633800 /NCGR_PEP_ID=MMETSP0088-20131115/888_1 /ASSEMBLY_ACC=CAM_ASM_001087 /TAXON_ID=426623 /ORGANISM="Chaetoceros affinis, Strain CCMP159" /LENGTH=100 /DNA_ID=CAMNT_0050487251 /DNA_START=398 /DNA_END=700 /DNA_ORIENTATION=+